MQELLACFSSKNVLAKHKEVCLSINGTQSVRFQKGTIEFQNYFKQICVERYEGSYPKKYQDHTFVVVLLTSLFVLMINLPNQ